MMCYSDVMTFEDLAAKIMFGGGLDVTPASLAGLGFEYRKNKTSEHLRKAVSLGLKAGHGKVEFEESEIALRLSGVLKTIK